MDRFTPEVPAASLDAGGAGLFVDPLAGPPWASPAASRSMPLSTPGQGGEVRRLRDGLDGTPRPEGFTTFLEGMADAMTLTRAPAAGVVTTSAANGAAGFAAEIAAYFGATAARGDEARAYLAGQQALLSERETSALGVDTDAQLQFLMLVEQTYAANARVLTVVDSLLKQLLEI
jgi:flagellar hook-associated protein 1